MSIARPVLSIFCGAAIAFAQGPAAVPTFEVVSIKPVPPPDYSDVAGGKHVGMSIDGAQVAIGSVSLAFLIQTAYQVKSYRVSGPDWINTQNFDVLAKLPEGASHGQVPEMLQAMLADRFKLAIHRESKERSVYALVAGKVGLKLKEAEPGPPGRVFPSIRSDGTMHVLAERMTLAGFADFLTNFVDRPVLDMTGLAGSYRIELDMSTADGFRNIGPPAATNGAASDPAGSSIFSGIQRLGLKLEPRKMPVEIVVIDHVERMPTEN
jgi:uncharacterized protein (TIGR03435 family)